jgi:uncharacterized membrane protein
MSIQSRINWLLVGFLAVMVIVGVLIYFGVGDVW